MDQIALVKERIEAGNRFLSAFEKSTRVAVAFWLREGEEDEWNLYVASDRFNEGKLGMAYREVMDIAREMRDPYLKPFQLKLAGLTDPVVQATLDYYKTHSPKIPFHLRGGNIGSFAVEEIYLIKGPTGEYSMPSGREMLNQIIDQEAAFYQQHGRPPRKMKLPVLMAYDLAKCGRNEVGDLTGRVFMEGITVFEKEGFHGMTVEIIRDRNAALEFE